MDKSTFRWKGLCCRLRGTRSCDLLVSGSLGRVGLLDGVGRDRYDESLG